MAAFRRYLWSCLAFRSMQIYLAETPSHPLACLTKHPRQNAQGTEETNVSLARDLLDHYGSVIVSLVRLYADYNEVVSLVLRLMVAYGDRVLPLLSDAEALRLFAVCADLMKVYSEHHLGTWAELGAGSNCVG